MAEKVGRKQGELAGFCLRSKQQLENTGIAAERVKGVCLFFLFSNPPRCRQCKNICTKKRFQKIKKEKNNYLQNVQSLHQPHNNIRAVTCSVTPTGMKPCSASSGFICSLPLPQGMSSHKSLICYVSHNLFNNTYSHLIFNILNKQIIKQIRKNILVSSFRHMAEVAQ